MDPIRDRYFAGFSTFLTEVSARINKVVRSSGDLSAACDKANRWRRFRVDGVAFLMGTLWGYMMIIRGDIAGCITVISCNIYIYTRLYNNY